MLHQVPVLNLVEGADYFIAACQNCQIAEFGDFLMHSWSPSFSSMGATHRRINVISCVAVPDL